MPLSEQQREKRIFQAFEIGIVLKGVGATLEAVLGALLLFSNGFNNLVLALLQNALIEDPDNFFATHLQSFLIANPRIQFYGGLYLLAEGIVKIVLVIGLLRGKTWAYPAALGILSLFIFYQTVRLFMHYSLPILLLTLFDLLVISLIFYEYRRRVPKPARM
jgi:uncharacterized membrane protein